MQIKMNSISATLNAGFRSLLIIYQVGGLGARVTKNTAFDSSQILALGASRSSFVEVTFLEQS